MRGGRPGTHIPEYHPPPSLTLQKRQRTRLENRQMSPKRHKSLQRELVSPKVPGLYGGQNHGCSSKLQNSVMQVFL